MAENEVNIPADIAVNLLRQEIATLNDERLSLMMQLQFANQTIADLQAYINVITPKEEPTEVTAVDVVDESPSDTP